MARIPAPLRTDGTLWTDNILVPSQSRGASVTATNLNWGIQPGGPYSSVSVPWSGPICAMPAYVRRILKKCAALRATSVTISFERIVWCAYKVSPLPAESSAIVW